MILSLSSINFLERLTELRETYYSLDCWFIVKGFNSAQPDGSHARGSAWREGSELSHPLIEPHCLDLHVLTRPGNSPYPLLWGFSGSYIALARLIKSLSIDDWNQSPAPLLTQESEGGVRSRGGETESADPLLTCLVHLETSHRSGHLEVLQKPPHYRNKGSQLGHSKGFRSSAL